jgi:hypothetical protein
MASVSYEKPSSADAKHQVGIELTQDQIDALEKLTGEKIRQLRITVEDLTDLAGVIVN